MRRDKIRWELSKDKKELIISVDVAFLISFVLGGYAPAQQSIVNILFTEREKEVMELLLAGKVTKEIAVTLSLSIRTIKFHLSQIYRKAQVDGKIGLLRLGLNLDNLSKEKR